VSSVIDPTRRRPAYRNPKVNLGGVDRRLSVHVDPLSMAEARDGEQVQLPDLAGGSVDTQHFFPTAAAPEVSNLPAPDAPATVWIDPEGLHVTDGAIFLTDYSGESVLTAAGFAGSWSEFVHAGVYNSRFSAGVVDAQETGFTGTAYSASFPYWGLSGKVGTLTLTHKLTGNEHRLEAASSTSGTQKQSIFQFVPVVAGEVYEWVLDFATTVVGTPPGTTVGPRIYLTYLARDMVTETLAEFQLVDERGGATQNRFVSTTVLGTTAGTVWVKVRIELDVTATATSERTVKLYDFSLRPFMQRSAFWVHFLDTWTAIGFKTSAVHKIENETGHLKLIPALDSVGQRRVHVGGEIVLDNGLAEDLRLVTQIISTVNANTNDWAPSGVHDAAVLQVNSFTANRTFTGLSAGADGDVLIIFNNTAWSMNFWHNDAASAAVNRFRCPGAAAFTLRSNGSVMLHYRESRWNLIAA
jgi:hypothetical protein